MDDWIKAGKIAAQARDYGSKLIVPGAMVREVLDQVEKRIAELGGAPAFPAQISINEVAAHFCPGPEDDTRIKEGDLVKLDLGVHINGAIGDTAVSIDLGDHRDLVKASQNALAAAIKTIRPGVTLAEIGKAIQDEITALNFSPVKNLSGHGLDRFNIHCAPTIPNVDTGDPTQLTEGQTIAIEPFSTDGMGMIYESSNPTVFSQIAKRPSRNPFTRKALAIISKYNGLPFTTRWLAREIGIPQTNYALRDMQQLGMIEAFPPLPERNGGMVAQSEHSLIVKEKPVVTTLSEE